MFEGDTAVEAEAEAAALMMSAACEIGVCSSAMFMFYFIPFVCSPTEVFGLEHHDKKEQIEKRDLTFSATP